MRHLSQHDCHFVSGAITGKEAATAAGALMGGYMAYEVASFLSPLSTLIGTVGTGATAAIVCTPFAPVVGTILCGSAGLLVGYVFSSSIANVAAFGLGAAAGGYAANNAMS